MKTTKNILILVAGFLMLILLNACPGPFEPTSPLSSVYLGIDTEGIKDVRVKTIKITCKNLDKIKPQYSININISPNINSREIHPKEISGIEINKINGVHILTIKREKYIEFFKEIVYFPRSFIILFKGIYDETAEKKRTYELKMYINDTLFFRKKISLTPEKWFHSMKLENMEYVDKKYGIIITDTDIKKWLKK